MHKPVYLPTLIKLPWLSQPETIRLITTLNKHQIEFIFCGGAVRDLLAGLEPHDIDILAKSSCAEIISMLQKSALEFDTTYRTYGIVKVFIEDKQFDIICLWDKYNLGSQPLGTNLQDLCLIQANHSDFSINCFFAMINGQIFYFHNALEDLRAKRIRFIEASGRNYATDPRLILRYIRFQTIYGTGEIEPSTLHLIRQHAHHLKAAPALQSEMNYFLGASKPYRILNALLQYDILPHIFGFTILGCDGINTLEKIETMIARQSKPSVRLLLLLNEAEIPPDKALNVVMHDWKFSEENRRIMNLLQKSLTKISVSISLEDETRLSAELGVSFESLVLLSWALEEDIHAATPAYLAMLEKHKVSKL